MTKSISIVQKGIDLLFKAVAFFCGLQLLFMVLVVASQVFLRTFFKVSIKWGEEMVLIAMVWITFLTLAIGLKENLHIRIGFVVDALPGAARTAVHLFGDLALLFASACMMYYGWLLVKFTMASTLPATGLPSAVTYGIVVASGVLCCTVMLSRLPGRSRRVKAGTEENGEDIANG